MQESQEVMCPKCGKMGKGEGMKGVLVYQDDGSFKRYAPTMIYCCEGGCKQLASFGLDVDARWTTVDGRKISLEFTDGESA